MNGCTAISQAFSGGKALLSYIMAGDPDLETTKTILRTLDRAGADLLEVGIPFSDPLADGPVIQAAGIRALEQRVSTASVLELLRSLREELRAPRILMSYANPLLRYGEGFAADAAAAGVAGVLIPDLPFSERGRFAAALSRQGIALLAMVAPNSSEERLREIGENAEGFLYCVSILGTTGNSGKLAATVTTGATGSGGLEDYLRRVRRFTKIPAVVGFGIDGPEQARRIAPHADGIVVGSALVRLVERFGNDRPALVAALEEFVRSVKSAMAGAAPHGEGA
jgi:tryptophan synthase alpha chain